MIEPTPELRIAIYAALVFLMVAGTLGLAHVLGERHRGRGTRTPYESGMLPSGDAWVPVTPWFYVVAMLFVVFDVEVAFLVVWAIAAREAGWIGFVEMVVFVGVLLAALGWLWRVGALDSAPPRSGRAPSGQTPVPPPAGPPAGRTGAGAS